MIKEVTMPKLGQTVEEAVIETWHKKEGDTVNKGDILLEITTDKATLEMESFVEGIVKKIIYPEGETVPVNSVIAYVGDEDDEVPEIPSRPQEKQVPAGETPAQADASMPQAAPSATPVPGVVPPAHRPTHPSGRIFASPRARMRVQNEKVPLACIRGSGPGGRIIEQDVLDYVEKRSRLRITPVAIRIAYTRQVDVLQLEGTGPGRRICR